MGRNPVESGEQIGDVFLGLALAPPVTGVAVNVIEAVGCRLLDANGGHGSGLVPHDHICHRHGLIALIRRVKGVGELRSQAV